MDNIMTTDIKTPLHIQDYEGNLIIDRSLSDMKSRLDNLIELIAFTSRGGFYADPDFGFEYWNHEFSNVNLSDFNNEQKNQLTKVSKLECEESIRNSLTTYAPSIKQLSVEVNLLYLSVDEQKKRKTKSRYEVSIKVSGDLDNGLGTTEPYLHNVNFLVEPNAKK
jgi:hypothetical protein